MRVLLVGFITLGLSACGSGQVDGPKGQVASSVGPVAAVAGAQGGSCCGQPAEPTGCIRGDTARPAGGQLTASTTDQSYVPAVIFPAAQPGQDARVGVAAVPAAAQSGCCGGDAVK